MPPTVDRAGVKYVFVLVLVYKYFYVIVLVFVLQVQSSTFLSTCKISFEISYHRISKIVVMYVASQCVSCQRQIHPSHMLDLITLKYQWYHSPMVVFVQFMIN